MNILPKWFAYRFGIKKNNITSSLYIIYERTSSFGNAGRLLFVVCLWLLSAGSALSQEFSVSSFRILPNDVSAFVNSVRDLNDEACAW